MPFDRGSQVLFKKIFIVVAVECFGYLIFSDSMIAPVGYLVFLSIFILMLLRLFFPSIKKETNLVDCSLARLVYEYIYVYGVGTIVFAGLLANFYMIIELIE